MTREEAIKIVRNIYQTDAEKEALGTLIPELAESEDERVRRELIEYLKGDLDDITTDDTDRWITWIEKQEDCILVPKSHFEPVGKPGVDGMKILEKQKPAEWSKNDTVFLNEIIDYFENKTVKLQHDIDMYAHWLKSLPERFNLQPKEEWSEEDKAMIERLIRHVQKEFDELCNDRYGHQEIISDLKEDCRERMRWLERLKSLRPQYHGDVTMTEAYKMGKEAGKASSWKPSEDDIKMLEHIIGQYETGNKNSKVMGYLPRVEELNFLKKVLAKWKNLL